MVITLRIFLFKKSEDCCYCNVISIYHSNLKTHHLEDIYSDVMLKSDSWEFVRHYTIRDNK